MKSGDKDKMGWRVGEQGWRKGPWTPLEDKLLCEYVKMHGEGRWSSVAACAGLNRTGKSCRLRWVNYLRPGLKRGRLTPQEEAIIIELHALWGNKWSTIARYLPGRTDNEIKNYWRTHFKKKDKSSKKKETNFNQKLQQQQQDQPMGDDHDGNQTQSKQENSIAPMHHTAGDQCLGVINEDVGYWTDYMTEDNLVWGGLWNFDDTLNYTNVPMHN